MLFKSLNLITLILCSFLIIESNQTTNDRMRIIHHQQSQSTNRDRRTGGDEHQTSSTRPLSNIRRDERREQLKVGDDLNENILQRIYDKLLTIQNLDEQKLKRLESLEYKFNRFEVSNQERNDGIRSELRDVLRRVQNLDWLTTKTEASIEQLRTGLDDLRDGVHKNGGTTQSSRYTAEFNEYPEHGNNGHHNNNNKEFDDKLDSLAILITSARSAIHRIERDLHATGLNISSLLQSNKEITQMQKSMPTRQFLNNALVNMKQQPYAVIQSPPHGFTQRSNGLVTNGNGNQQSDMNTTPSSCTQITSKKTGVHKIHVEGSMLGPFFVYCDMDHYDGGWTVIQSRLDGAVNFYRNWLEYKNGFGNLGGEFWIGLDKLHEITSSKIHELLIVMEDLDGVERFARYSSFAIGSEKENYALILLGQYTGNAGDSFSYHGGQKFSTFDLDNDSWAEGNCAISHSGGWWYNACDNSNLNGRYLSGEVPEDLAYHGIYWEGFHGRNYSLEQVKMMIRPTT